MLAMACRVMFRQLLGRLDLLELRAKGAQPLITMRKVGGGEVEHNAWIVSPSAYLEPLGNEAVRLIALTL